VRARRHEVRRHAGSERTLVLQVDRYGEAERAPAGMPTLTPAVRTSLLPQSPAAGERPGRERRRRRARSRRGAPAGRPIHPAGTLTESGRAGINRCMKPGHGHHVSARIRRARILLHGRGTSRWSVVAASRVVSPSTARLRQAALRLGRVPFAATGARSGSAFENSVRENGQLATGSGCSSGKVIAPKPSRLHPVVRSRSRHWSPWRAH
jgi:hypothetical protein